MKKAFTWALALTMVITLALSGCSAQTAHEYLEAKTVSFENFEEMEAYSPCIVKGVRLDTEEPVIKTTAGYVTAAYTLSKFRIDEVCKDSTGTLKKGDIITILENEAYSELENKTYHIADYNMMTAGSSYLLFLVQAEMDGFTYYAASGVNFGTISLEEDGRLNSRTGASRQSAYAAPYEAIWQDAKDKYG